MSVVPDDQMTFEDVVELETVHGDADYTEWLVAGRPQVDTAVSLVRRRRPYPRIETLPGL